MANVLFDGPPVLAGTPEAKLQQLYAHLGILSNKLNEALMTISIDQMPAEVRTAVGSAVEAEESNADKIVQMKSLIIKNAEIVRNEMEEIRTTLTAHYEAISEQFGTYQEDVEARIAANAYGIEQNYTLIQNVQSAEADSETMIRKLSGSVFSGIIDTNTGEIGIAIGYNVTNDDGTLNMGNRMVTLTADALTFYVNGAKAAWFGNSVFYIENGEVTKSMRMGKYIWQIFTNGAMGLMKA